MRYEFRQKTFLLGKLSAVLGISALLLSGCGGSGGDSDTEYSLGLPAGLTIAMVDVNNLEYYSLDTTTEELTDLNALADESGDSAVQKLRLTDTSVLGSFVHWPDFRVVNDVEMLDGKYLLMKPDYVPSTTVLGGTEESPGNFVQLVHFHDTDLAAHSTDEFYGADACSQADQDAGTCSGKYYGLQRLNSFVTEQADLEIEIAEALPEDQTLCRAYIDPYQKFEHEQEEALEESGGEIQEEAHDHGALTHFALTDTGRMYFYQEGEAGLESIQGFVELDGVNSVADCSRTTIARASEDGVLVFIPDTQKLYLVDNHGADFHQHSVWNLAEILPEGTTADMAAILGEGTAHEHEE
jgi:hypothetical protein